MPDAGRTRLMDKIHDLQFMIRAYEKRCGTSWEAFDAPLWKRLWFYEEVLKVMMRRIGSTIVKEFEKALRGFRDRLTGNKTNDRRTDMEPRIFKYFDGWETEVLTCWKCGWKGTFDEGSVEVYRELQDSTCPVCAARDPFNAPMLAIVEYPTLADYEKNWDRLSEDQKSYVTAIKEFQHRWELSRLKTEINLPELEGESLVLTWDFRPSDTQDRVTVIRLGEREIWRELACYEGYRRYEEVVEILKKKYGPRLADVVPTPVSKTYLYGDDSRSVGAVEKVRESLQREHRAWLSQRQAGSANGRLH